MSKTVEEISKELNISKTRVQQLCNSGIKKFFNSFKAFDRDYYDMLLISHNSILKSGGDIDIFDYYKMLPYNVKQKIKKDAFRNLKH